MVPVVLSYLVGMLTIAPRPWCQREPRRTESITGRAHVSPVLQSDAVIGRTLETEFLWVRVYDVTFG
jgi:hypothetical protein